MHLTSVLHRETCRVFFFSFAYPTLCNCITTSHQSQTKLFLCTRAMLVFFQELWNDIIANVMSHPENSEWFCVCVCVCVCRDCWGLKIRDVWQFVSNVTGPQLLFMAYYYYHQYTTVERTVKCIALQEFSKHYKRKDFNSIQKKKNNIFISSMSCIDKIYYWYLHTLLNYNAKVHSERLSVGFSV